MYRLKSFFGRTTAAAVPVPDSLGILVVDDEISVLRYAELVLKRAGYAPRLASSGEEALQVAATMERLDIVVTDLLMPGMHGDELARQLRQRDPDLKVLYQTGFSDRLFAEKSVLWDQEAFIDKPYSTGALEQAVALLLYGHVMAPGSLAERARGQVALTVESGSPE
jgi:two-component system cell cycle sensor histidine kinase/response regulator CckA